MTSLGCLAFTVQMIYVQSCVFKFICWKEKACLCHLSSDFNTSAYRSEGFFQHNNSPTRPVFQLEVNDIDPITIQCSAGKLWVLADMKMQNEDLNLLPKHGYHTLNLIALLMANRESMGHAAPTWIKFGSGTLRHRHRTSGVAPGVGSRLSDCYGPQGGASMGSDSLRHFQLMINRIGIWGIWGPVSMPWALCAIPEQSCVRTHCLVHNNQGMPLPWGGVVLVPQECLGGWFVTSGIPLNVRTQDFPAAHWVS